MRAIHALLWLVLLVLGFAVGIYWNNHDYTADESASAKAILVSNNATGYTASADEETPLPSTGATTERTDYTPEELHTIRLFENAAASVCFITTSNLRQNYYSRDITEVPRGTGSGFVWDRAGHIVTNYHVIENADRLQVTLANGESYEAKLVGTEAGKDLAVLKIEVPTNDLLPLPAGSSENLRVGQAVYAIGNPFGLDQSLTTGIVSALDREIQSRSGLPIRGAIQSDAAINPGNSGGPLLDSNGKLIGVNTAIYSPSGASAGVGFSIPVDVVKWVVPELIEHGKVIRPTLGIELRNLTNDQGVAVWQVVPGSAAEKAGLRPTYYDPNRGRILGDVITGLDGRKIASGSDLILELENYNPGDEVVLSVLRGDQQKQLRVRLDAAH